MTFKTADWIGWKRFPIRRFMVFTFALTLTITILLVLPFPSLASTAGASAPPPSSSGSSSGVRSVSVLGTCLRTAQADRGSITVTVDVLLPNLQAAAKKATEAYEKVKRSIEKIGLKDMEFATSEYTFQEVHEWKKDRNVFKGFRARMGMNVSSSEFARLGEVIAIAANEGVREVSGLTTSLSPEKAKAEGEKCLEEAVKNARLKAEAIARAASVRVGRVLAVSEGALAAASPMPRPEFSAVKSLQAEAADVAAPSVDAGPQRIAIEVAVTYSLE